MPLFLRALPLSLATLWHYVFVLPLVLIVCLPILVLTYFPLMGIPVVVTMTAFVTFVGFRCALAAFGAGNEPSIAKLVQASFSWVFINLLFGTVLMIAAFGIGRGLALLGFSDQLRLRVIYAVPYGGGLAAAAYLVLISVYTAAMAVPMTAGAHAATTRARDPGLFFGIGGGLFSLLVASSTALTGLVHLGFLDIILDSVAKGLLITIARVVETDLEAVVEIDWFGLAIAVTYVVWCTCWFCATAVLAWDRKRQLRQAAEETEIARTPRVSAEDLRALREARMPGTREQE